MAKRAKGEVLLREWKSGRGYALRFIAYGEREYLTLGFEHEGWTYELATEALENIMADVRRAIWVAPPKKRGPSLKPDTEEEAKPAEGGAILFPAFARPLLASRRGRHSENHHSYLEWGLAHLEPFFAQYPLLAIDEEAVDAYSAAKVAEGEELAEATRRGKPRRDERGRVRKALSAASINKTIEILAWALGFAIEYKKYGLTANPAEGKRRRLTEPERRPVWLDTAEQIEALIDAAEELDREPRRSLAERKAILTTLIFAGPRALEAGHMLWRDIDLANGRIFVGRSKTRAGLREITMVPILRDILAAHKAAAPRTGPDDLVFPTPDGERRGKDNLRERVCGPVFERAEELLAGRGQVPLPVGLTPHKLRHTFASILIAIGEDPSTVMEQLGHTDSKFTLNVYTHIMARSPAERARLKALVAGERPGHEPSRPARLGAAAYEGPILRALAERGGRSTRRMVLAAVGAQMDGRFGEADRAPYRGKPRWQVDADVARRRLVARGMVKKARREGVWVLSEAGAERLRPGPTPDAETARGRERGAEIGAVREEVLSR